MSTQLKIWHLIHLFACRFTELRLLPAIPPHHRAHTPLPLAQVILKHDYDRHSSIKHPKLHQLLHLVGLHLPLLRTIQQHPHLTILQFPISHHLIRHTSQGFPLLKERQYTRYKFTPPRRIWGLVELVDYLLGRNDRKICMIEGSSGLAPSNHVTFMHFTKFNTFYSGLCCCFSPFGHMYI